MSESTQRVEERPAASGSASVAQPAATPGARFQPFVPAHETRPELTIRAILLGCIFGLLFGAVSVYVGLRAGMTVAASIPIAVLSISVLRGLGRASILENNIVQTTGNAGQSIAAGVIFSIPALIFLGFRLEYWTIFFLALIGGWLGVFFMIPLRRQLIVEEHGKLTYPEGTACADVLLAGEHSGSFASKVFWGLGLGSLYTLFQNGNLLGAWPDTPKYEPRWLKGAAISADATAEYLGVGYIIGSKVSGVIFAGGILSWLVIMPAIYFFGSRFPHAIYPGTMPIAQMTPNDLWGSYIRPMGAGAVAAAGLITLLKTVPTIWSALSDGMSNLKKSALGGSHALRTEDDISMPIVLLGSVGVVIAAFLLLVFRPVPGAEQGWVANLVAALLIVIFGFLFVTVSSRIVGLIGSTANPTSGMTIATLMATTAIFLIKGWTAPAFGALAISIGGIVAIASANAGDTSQDLKTGFLVGATPRKQQIALLIGVSVSTFAVGGTLLLMNDGLATFREVSIPWNISVTHDGVSVQEQHFQDKEIRVIHASGSEDVRSGSQYVLLNALGSRELADGKYLYDPAKHAIEVQWIPGIGSQQAAAPQARLMATVISGILGHKLPWNLVLLGVFLVVVVELLGIRSLPFAVGTYLPVSATSAIFIGGVVRWITDRSRRRQEGSEQEEEMSSGSLYASGLIAAGGIVGLAGVALRLYEATSAKADLLRLPVTNPFHHDWVSVLMFALLAISLGYFARQPVNKPAGHSAEEE